MKGSSGQKPISIVLLVAKRAESRHVGFNIEDLLNPQNMGCSIYMYYIVLTLIFQLKNV